MIGARRWKAYGRRSFVTEISFDSQSRAPCSLRVRHSADLGIGIEIMVICPRPMRFPVFTQLAFAHLLNAPTGGSGGVRICGEGAATGIISGLIWHPSLPYLEELAPSTLIDIRRKAGLK